MKMMTILIAIFLLPINATGQVIPNGRTTVEIKTWGCSNGYRQDFEPTEANMRKHLGLGANQCPNNRTEVMVPITDPKTTMKMIVKGLDDLEAEIVGLDALLVKADKPVLTTKEKDDYRAARKIEIQSALTAVEQYRSK